MRLPWAVPLFVTLVLLPVALVGALLGGLEVPSVQARLLVWLAETTPLRLDGVSIAWPFDLRAERLSLVDGEGVWLSADQVRLVLDVNALPGGRLAIDRLTAQTVELSRLPQGGGTAATPSLPRLPLALRLGEASVEQLKLRPWGITGRASLTGRLEGGHLALILDTAGTAKDITGQARLTVDGRESAITLVGTGALGGLAAPIGSATWSLAGGFDFANGTANIASLRLDTPPGHALISGWIEDWGQHPRLRLSAQGQLAALSPQLGGSLILNGSLTEDQAELSGQASHLSTGQAALDARLGSSPRLRLSLALHPRLASGQISGAQGEASLNALLFGSINDPLFGTEAKAQSGDIDARLLALARWPEAHARLTVHQQARSGEAEADIAWGPLVHLDRLTLRALGGEASGQLAWDRATGLGQGRLAGSLPLGSGRAGFDLTLAPGQGQTAHLSARTVDIALGGLALRHAELVADGQDLLGSPRLTGHLTGQGGPLRLDASGSAEPQAGRYGLANLTLDVGPQTLRLTAPSSVEIDPGSLRLAPTELSLAGGGKVEAAGSLRDGQLLGQVTLTNLPASLAAPLWPGSRPSGGFSGLAELSGTPTLPQLHLRLSGRDLDLRGHHAGITTQAEARWDGKRLSASLTAQGLHGAQLDAAAELPLTLVNGQPSVPDGPLSGHLSGKIDIAHLAELVDLGDQTLGGALALHGTAAGGLAHPDIDAEAKVTDGHYENFDSGTVLKAITLQATARDSRHLTLHAEGGDGGQGKFTAEGQADLQDGPSYSAEIEVTGLRLANLDVAKGNGSGRLHLEGIGDQAGLSGNLTMDDTEIDIGQSLPVQVVHLDVEEINVPPGSKPARTPSGPPLLNLALAVDLKLTRAQVRGRGLDSQWSGQAALGGTPDAPTLEGQAKVDRGSYDFYGRRLELSDGTLTFDGQSPINPRLDMTGRGAARDVTAQVHVTGTLDKPELEFTSDPPVPRDEVLSRLLFNTEAGQLSVTQQLTLARVAAGQLTGGADELDPLGKMRQMLGLDILQAGSGENTTSLSALGLPGFAGSAQTTNLGPLAAAATATQSRNIGPSLSAGKYLDERTLLRLDQGTTGGQVTVEVELGHGFSVDTHLGEDAGGGVGLTWKKDY